MRLAIVILNWNGQQMMERYLPGVIACSPEGEVIVADNASTDGSIAMLREKFPDVRLLQLDRNYGFAEGYNKALRQIEADYYLLLNSDVEVTPGWLRPLLRFMDNHPEVAACQPKLLSIYNKEKFEYAGASGGYIDCLGYPYCRGRVFDSVEADQGQYDDPREVHWATGACLLARAKDYWRVGGLDGRFFAHNEEIDLCWRLRILGKQIFVLPESHVYHVGGGTLPKGNPMKTFLNFRNNLTMLYKNLPQRDLRRVMLWRWLLDYLAAWETLIVNRNVADFKAIYRARHAFRRWKHDFDPDRARIQQSRKSADAGQLAPYSILWNYYVHGRRKFSELK